MAGNSLLSISHLSREVIESISTKIGTKWHSAFTSVIVAESQLDQSSRGEYENYRYILGSRDNETLLHFKLQHYFFGLRKKFMREYI